MGIEPNLLYLFSQLNKIFPLLLPLVCAPITLSAILYIFLNARIPLHQFPKETSHFYYLGKDQIAMFCAIALLFLLLARLYKRQRKRAGLVSNILFDKEYICSRSGSTDCLSTLHMLYGAVNSTICQYFTITSCLLVPRLPPRGRIARYISTLCLPSESIFQKLGSWQVDFGLFVCGRSYLLLNITTPSVILYYNYHKQISRGKVYASNIFAYNLIHI